MYSTARKMSTLSAIGCAANIIGLLLFLMMSSTLQISFALQFAILTYMITMTVVSFMLTLGMRGLCQDLDSEYENSTLKFRELNKKIKELESKM